MGARAGAELALARTIAVAAAALASRESAVGRPARSSAETAWTEAFVELVRAVRVAGGRRRALVAHARPAL